MIVTHLWLTDFRNHLTTDIEFDNKVTLVIGLNGHGKTNLVEGLFLLSGCLLYTSDAADE